MNAEQLTRNINKAVNSLATNLAKQITEKITSLSKSSIHMLTKVVDDDMYIKNNKNLLLPKISYELQRSGYEPIKYTIYCIPTFNKAVFWLYLRTVLATK